MDAALAALLGAAIGAAGSFGVMLIQQRHQNRRERLGWLLISALLTTAGSSNWRKTIGSRCVFHRYPAYVMYHAEFFDALANGEITPEIIQGLQNKQEQLMKHYYDYRKPREP